MKKIISVIVAAALLGSNAAAVNVTTAGEKAEVLYRLGLIKGISDEGFNPGLGLDCTREQAAAAILRVTGNIDNVYAEKHECSFSDVSEWAKPYIAYGESIGLCQGISDGYFGAEENITLRQICTMYLRMLGYKGAGDIYDSALETAKPLGMCSEEEDRYGTRSDLIDISYNTLYVSLYGSTTALIRYLADSGATTLSAITAAGDDGLMSAYISSNPVSGTAGSDDELRGDLEHAMSYSFTDNSGKGMSVISKGEETEYEGIECSKIDVGSSISFKLDDEYVSADDKYFTLVVKYFDSGVDRIRIAYNVANMPYCSGYIAKTNTNTWREARLVIKNAQFSHAQKDETDISVFAESEGGEGVSEYISELMLVKQQIDEQAVNPLEVEPVLTTAFISFDGMGQSSGLTQTPGANSGAYNYTEQTDIGGEACISIGVNKRCTLNLDDDYMDPDDNNCQIIITYYDHGTDRIRYSYSTEEKRYKDVFIQKTGTDTWMTHILDVNDASFMNRQDAGIDFSIWGLSTDNSKTGEEKEYIGRVEIIKK